MVPLHWKTSPHTMPIIYQVSLSDYQIRSCIAKIVVVSTDNYLQNTPQSFRLLSDNHVHIQSHRHLSALPLKLSHQFLRHLLSNILLTRLSKSYHRHGHQRLQCPSNPSAGPVPQMRSCSTIVFLDVEVTKADAFGCALDVLCRFCVEVRLVHGTEEEVTCFDEAWWLGGHIAFDGVHVDFFPLEVATWFCAVLVTTIWKYDGVFGSYSGYRIYSLWQARIRPFSKHQLIIAHARNHTVHDAPLEKARDSSAGKDGFLRWFA